MLYLPGANFYLFHLTPAFIFCFSNYIFLKFILDKKIFHKERTINFLSLLSFCFINTFFYRLAEHGTDRSGMIFDNHIHNYSPLSYKSEELFKVK